MIPIGRIRKPPVRGPDRASARASRDMLLAVASTACVRCHRPLPNAGPSSAPGLIGPEPKDRTRSADRVGHVGAGARDRGLPFEQRALSGSRHTAVARAGESPEQDRDEPEHHGRARPDHAVPTSWTLV
jgi:hypothetical protein